MGNYEIYYKRSTDGGTNWGPDSRITNYSSSKFNSCISASGTVLHVVWRDNRNGNAEIYYKRSTDEGITWGSDIRLSNNDSLSDEPCIKVSGSSLYVMWSDKRDGNLEIYYKLSTDGGTSWEADTRLTNTPYESSRPSISVTNQIVHVVWCDASFGPNKTCYKRSTNDGATWSVDTILSSNVSSAFYPCISSSGQYVQVVWEEHHDGNSEIYWMGSSNTGISWRPEVRLTNNPSTSDRPSIAASGQNIHIVWADGRDGNWEIYYKQSVDAGNNWGSDIRLTNSPFISEASCIIASDSVVNVLWEDNRDGNYEIYYKRNPTGNLTGIQNINSEIPEDYVLEQNYPNPFNPSTKIRFVIPDRSKISLKVQDITGRTVQNLFYNKEMNAGTFEYEFNGTGLASGIYFYSLYSNGLLTQSKKMILVK
jgi:hypothetical protein